MLTRSKSKQAGGVSNDKKSMGLLPPDPNCQSTSLTADSENCCICMAAIKNRCTTNGVGCRHEFCYGCLRIWSKSKAECPLCKRTFTKIFHNFRNVNGVVLREEFNVRPAPSVASSSLSNGISGSVYVPDFPPLSPRFFGTERDISGPFYYQRDRFIPLGGRGRGSVRPDPIIITID